MLLHDVDALEDFEIVAGVAAEGLIHPGEEGDGVGAGRFSSLDHESGKEAGVVILFHEGAGACFDVEDESVEALGELLAHDACGDEVRGLDGAGVIAEAVEDAVGGDERGGLADEGGAAFAEDLLEAREGKLGVESGDRFELVERAAGVAEGAAGDHGDADAGDAVRIGDCDACRGEDGGDEDGCFVADAAGAVFVDGEGLERPSVEGFSRETHGAGQRCELLGVEAALEGCHEEGSDLGVGDELMLWGALDDSPDESLNFDVGEGESVAFVQDDVEGVDGHWLSRLKAEGRRSARVQVTNLPPVPG